MDLLKLPADTHKNRLLHYLHFDGLVRCRLSNPPTSLEKLQERIQWLRVIC